MFVILLNMTCVEMFGNFTVPGDLVSRFNKHAKFVVESAVTNM